MTNDLLKLGLGARLAWAKTGADEDSLVGLWLPLVGHGMDATDVAEHLWDEWLSEGQRALLARPFRQLGDDAPAAGRSFLKLAAALHDVGKATPSFARQVPTFADKMRCAGLSMAERGSLEAQEERWFKHALAGSLLIERMGEQRGWSAPVTVALASLAGGHHGMPARTDQKREARRSSNLLGTATETDAWEVAQDELVDYLTQYAGPDILFSEAEFDLPSLVLYQGCVTISDWIASSSEYFPLTPEADVNFRYLRLGGQQKRRHRALERFQLPAGWSPHNEGEDATELLRSRFKVPFRARPLQEAAVGAAREVEGAPLMIIEDVMGSGKTEAALLAAEILAARFGARGLLVALPTQATTDAMFERILGYLDGALTKSPGGPTSPMHSTALLHGRSGWSRRYSALKRTGRMFFDRSHGDFEIDMGEGVVDPDYAGMSFTSKVAAHPWFRGRHAAILSSFVTTTVDHLLMGALQIKQLPVRHAGLSGKVVIFDEAHASSDFMNFFAERVMQWLGAYGVPVVVLSATLTDELRTRLIEAYEQGRSTQVGPTRTPAPEPLAASGLLPPPEEAPAATSGELTFASEMRPYPRLTIADVAGVRTVPLAAALEPTTVKLLAHGPETTTAEVVLEVAKERSGNILVVCNTVGEAQRTYAELSRDLQEAVRLVHSRYTAADRLANDDYLLRLYGRDTAERPDFSIVVGTQVLEQSLDIDFDVLVTQLAPMDLLLQRIGRMHRHQGRERPEAFSNPVCHVTNVPRFEEEPLLDAGSRKVYRDFKLLAAAVTVGPDAFEAGGTTIELPNEVATVVEKAARVREDVPAAWRRPVAAAVSAEETARKNAAATVRGTLVPSPDTRTGVHGSLDDWIPVVGDPDSRDRAARAKVREGIEGEEVILLVERDGAYWTMPSAEHPAGVPFPNSVVPDHQTALAAALGTVTIPHYHCASAEALDALEEIWWAEWDQSPLLKGQLFLPLKDGEVIFAGRRLKYSKEFGLEISYGTR